MPSAESLRMSWASVNQLVLRPRIDENRVITLTENTRGACKQEVANIGSTHQSTGTCFTEQTLKGRLKSSDYRSLVRGGWRRNSWCLSVGGNYAWRQLVGVFCIARGEDFEPDSQPEGMMQSEVKYQLPRYHQFALDVP